MPHNNSFSFFLFSSNPSRWFLYVLSTVSKPYYQHHRRLFSSLWRFAARCARGVNIGLSAALLLFCMVWVVSSAAVERPPLLCGSDSCCVAIRAPPFFTDADDDEVSRLREYPPLFLLLCSSAFCLLLDLSRFSVCDLLLLSLFTIADSLIRFGRCFVPLILSFVSRDGSSLVFFFCALSGCSLVLLSLHSCSLRTVC